MSCTDNRFLKLKKQIGGKNENQEETKEYKLPPLNQLKRSIKIARANLISSVLEAT